MPTGSDYGIIPYEVDEIISWMNTYFDDNLPDVVGNAFSEIEKSWVCNSSTNLKKSSDGEVIFTYTGGYIKLKSITFNPSPSTYVKPGASHSFMIRFDLKRYTGTPTVWGRIYRNGIAVGTERGCDSSDWITYEEIISGWTLNDTIELWCDINSFSGICRNFRIYCDIDAFVYLEPVWED